MPDRRIAADLHINECLNVNSGRVLTKFRHAVALVQQLVLVEPLHAKMLRVPEVDVGVDKWYGRQGFSSS
jgi:hypothetical protein